VSTTYLRMHYSNRLTLREAEMLAWAAGQMRDDCQCQLNPPPGFPPDFDHAGGISKGQARAALVAMEKLDRAIAEAQRRDGGAA